MAFPIERLKPDTTIKINYREGPPRYVLAYWSTKCLAAPLRRMLEAAHVNHWNVLYDVKEEGDGWKKESYLKEKEWIKAELNPLVNLPFLIDVEKNVVISQTAVISRYLGTQLNMYGDNEAEQLKCDELLHELLDLHVVMTDFAYGTDPSEDAAAACLKRADYSFEKLEAHLKADGPGHIQAGVGKNPVTVRRGLSNLIRGKFTSPDFYLIELLDQFKSLCKHNSLPNFLASYPYLAEYDTNARAHPETGCYERSFCHMQLPFNNPYACFGSDPASMHYQRGQSTPWHGNRIVQEQRTNQQSPIIRSGIP
jgi:hypothetical protein